MEPIAVVHWVDEKGKERIRYCYTQPTLNKVTEEIRLKNCMSWTCLCEGHAMPPPNAQKSTVDRFKITG